VGYRAQWGFLVGPGRAGGREAWGSVVGGLCIGEHRLFMIEYNHHNMLHISAIYLSQT
jgi:hypothetical protein